MRSLSKRQAQRCEDAETPRCRCRCAGKYHGARRGRVDQLAEGDPHEVPRLCEECSTDHPPRRRVAFARLPTTNALLCRRCWRRRQALLPLGYVARVLSANERKVTP